jgi:Ca2+/Na+ antiporter
MEYVVGNTKGNNPPGKPRCRWRIYWSLYHLFCYCGWEFTVAPTCLGYKYIHSVVVLVMMLVMVLVMLLVMVLVMVLVLCLWNWIVRNMFCTLHLTKSFIKNKEHENEENYLMRSFIICTARLIFLGFFPPEGGVGLVPKRGYLFTLAYYTFPRWYEFGERRWNDTDRGKPKNSGKNLPSATLSTTNPTWIDPGANQGLRGDMPATNDLSHGTAISRVITKDYKWVGHGKTSAQLILAYWLAVYFTTHFK